MMDSNFSKTTGGNENFISFIEKELMRILILLIPHNLTECSSGIHLAA